MEPPQRLTAGSGKGDNSGAALGMDGGDEVVIHEIVCLRIRATLHSIAGYQGYSAGFNMLLKKNPVWDNN